MSTFPLVPTMMAPTIRTCVENKDESKVNFVCSVSDSLLL